MANDVTNPQWVHEHTGKTTAMRKGRTKRHGLKTLAVSKNEPYVNRARDLKPGRRLRAELRGEVPA